MRRLLVVPLLLALTACPKETPSEGAVKLTVSYAAFVPRCVRVTVRDVELTQEARTTELLGKGDARGGALTVAIFREKTWGHTLELTAEAFERTDGTRCEGTPAARQTRTLTVGTTVEESTLVLEGMDADKDGFLAVTPLGGSDCDDTRDGVKPGAAERCNGRDDDCNGTKDEGFGVGQLCDASNGCQGAWACTSGGTRACQVAQSQWYPDVDEDGHGARNGTPKDACTQPAGHVPNSDDCNDGNAHIRPGATERCNAVDEDCDGDPVNGLGVDTACSNGACPGTRQCVADGGVECDAPTPFTRLPDGDNDGYGARGAAPVTLCQPPDGGYAVDGGDCDDGNPQRKPGATERCNRQDDNCDDVQDETTFNLDAPCSPADGCTGKRACDAAGEATCQAVTFPTTWYPDEDLDTRGKADAGVPLCTAPDGGYVGTGTDCDDGDPFTYTDAPELCDLKDNNCDGSKVDTSVCPESPGWKPTTVGGTTRSWNAIALYGDGGVWVVGSVNGRALKTPQSTTFTPFESGCTGTWYSAWADPETGELYMGGASNLVATQEVSATACDINSKGKDLTTGLIGFRASNGNVDLYGVGSKTDFTAGWATRWNGGMGNGDIDFVAVTHPLISVSGPSPDLLFSVGGYIDPIFGTTEPRIYRYDPPSQTWKRDMAAPTSGLDFLNDVWVVHPKLAYAGGVAGTVLKWDGKTWTALPAPDTSNIGGILAFGTSTVYAVTGGGEVLRFNGQTWETLADFNVPLQDINGRGPDDLWVVGEGNRIIHWPQ